MSDDHASSASPTRILLLGDLQVVGPSGVIQIREGLPIRLFAALVTRYPSVVAADVLIEMLWGQQQPVDARNSLQAVISRLRRSLEPIRAELTVERAAVGYRLRCLDTTVLDSVVFERMVRALPTSFAANDLPATAEAALAQSEDALALWRGPPLFEVMYEEFAQIEITRLRELHVMAHERRAAALVALGRDENAVEALQALTGEYPLRESIWAALIRALYRSQRQGEALRAYSRARELLLDNLGVDPSPELRDLERRVLEQDASLDRTPSVLDYGDEKSDAEKRDQARVVDAPVARFASRVPEPVSALIGRGFEVDHVAELVTASRLVTLVGPGGVGKSRLAIEVALRQKEQWPTRVVEFGPLKGGDDVTLLIASETGVPSLPQSSPLDAVADALGEEPTLLVFDTCEHLIEPLAVAATTLLRRNPNIRILATSRQPLGVNGETVWTVPPLDLADVDASSPIEVSASSAVRLFVERARACRPGFTLDDDTGAVVAQICRTLDGLPLAIELAAARVSLLSPRRIAERLDDRFALLSQGARSNEPRQRSLRALIEWSYDLLSEDERVFFNRLSVLAGSFDLDATAAIAGHQFRTDPLELLGALVAHSLVTSLDGDRFALLDTLRAFATDQLEGADPEESASTHERHARWFLGVALAADPKSHGPLPGSWSRLRIESANCLATLEWFHGEGDQESVGQLTGALAGYWMLEGQILLAERWLGRASAAPCSDATAARVQRGVGVLQLYQSRFEESLAACERGVALARRTPDRVLVASCLLTLGSALWGVGRFVESEHVLTEAANTFHVEDDQRGQGFALARLGRTLLARDVAASLAVLLRSRALLEVSGDGWMACVAAEHTATALLLLGRGRDALEAAEEAVVLGEHVGSRAGRLTALLTLGKVLLAVGEADRARRVLEGALADAVQSGNPGGIADATDAAAAVAHAEGDSELAGEMLGASSALRVTRRVTVPVGTLAARSALLDEVEAAIGSERFDEVYRRGAERDQRWVIERFGQ